MEIRNCTLSSSTLFPWRTTLKEDARMVNGA
ncbi:uncharacterized protein G2W53_010502 [Senna tora]|uniref:Uncharacterized protein n=1 Tax=Senna tora TaxID=362788 RepID=A0A834WZW6_9FABA|nr:uncharacterized protein G2W53_010502 [Senna tora]